MDIKLIMKALVAEGYKGDGSKDSVKAFINEKNLVLNDESGKEIDVDSLFVSKKTVTITADAGEEVVVADAQADMPVEDASAPVKSVRNVKVPSAFGIGSSNVERKLYASKAAKGQTEFSDPDIAEACGAWMRYRILGNDRDGYAQKANDISILRNLGQKDLVLASGSTYPTMIAPYIQENILKYGCARKVVGPYLVDMATNTFNLNDITADAVVAVTAQNTAPSSDSTMALTNSQLVAQKALGTILLSNELMNDSALSIADITAGSFARGIAKLEDDLFFKGSTSAAYGVLDATGGITTGGGGEFTSTSKTWTAVTDSDITGLQGLLSTNFDVNEAVFVCTRKFFFTVLFRLQKAVGGVTLNEAINGAKSIYPDADANYFGTPVYFAGASSMPCISGTQGAAGPANRPLIYMNRKAHALGVVRNSLEIASSDQAAFTADSICVRAKERFAVKPVAAGTGSVCLIQPA